MALLIGYPMAYGIARATPKWRNTMLMLVVLPFWTSFLIRVYSWKVLLQGTGPINALLMYFGFIDEPMQILYTDVAIYSASSTHTCRSWCCRFTPRSNGSTLR